MHLIHKREEFQFKDTAIYDFKQKFYRNPYIRRMCPSTTQFKDFSNTEVKEETAPVVNF